MEAVGGPQTYVLGGAFNCGKGQPGQVAPVSHGAPAALFRAGAGTQHGRGRKVSERRNDWPGGEPASTTPQDTVERALAAARRGSETIVIADESSTANLRWAGNTLTTNGVAATRSLTVIAVDRRADGTAGVGMVARSGVTPGQVEDIVREAEKAAARGVGRRGRGGPGDGRAGFRSTPGRSPASATDFGVFRSFAAQLGETLRGAEAAGRKLYGFAEHGVTSTFLGTSAGVRARYDQPTGRLELNAKSADLSRSAWAGAGDAGLRRRGRGRAATPGSRSG